MPQHEATVTPKRKLTFERQDSKSSEPKHEKKQRVDLHPPGPTKTGEEISSPPTGTPPLKRQRSKGPGDSGNKGKQDPVQAKEAEEDENWALEKYKLKHGEVATSNDEGSADGEWWDQDQQQEEDDETQDYVEISPATSKKTDAKKSPKTVSNKKSNAEGEVPQQHVDQAPKTAAPPKKTTGSEGRKEAPSNTTKGKEADKKQQAKAKAKVKTTAKNPPQSKASQAKDATPLALENGNEEDENEGSEGEVGKYSASSKGPKEAKDPRDKAKDKRNARSSKKPEEKKVKNGSTKKCKPESPNWFEGEAEEEYEMMEQKKDQKDDKAEEVEQGEQRNETKVSQIMRSSTTEITQDTKAAEEDKEKAKQEKMKGYKARKARFYRSLASWDLNAWGCFQLCNAQSSQAANH